MNGPHEIERTGLRRHCLIEVERTLAGAPVEYLHQDRYDNRAKHPLNKNGRGPFCRLELPKLPDSPGVYAITLNDVVVYVGECQNLSERYGPRGYGIIHPRNCFAGGQSTNCKVNSKILSAIKDDSAPVLWFASESDTCRKVVERGLVSKLRPAWNGPG